MKQLYILHAPSDLDLANDLALATRQNLAAVEPVVLATGHDTINDTIDQLTGAAAAVIVVSEANMGSGLPGYLAGFLGARATPVAMLVRQQAILDGLQLPLAPALTVGAQAADAISTLLLNLARAADLPATEPSDATLSTPPDPLAPPMTVASQDATQPRWSRPPGAIQAVAPPQSVTLPQAPSAGAAAALAAGQVLAECSLLGPDGPIPASLSNDFGSWITALGGNWADLKTLQDVDLWSATADNLMDSSGSSGVTHRAWFAMGYAVTTLLHLASGGGGAVDSEAADSEAAEPAWIDAMAQLTEAAERAALSPATVAVMEGMLENLRGPESGRDYSNVAQVKDTLRQHAQAAEAA